MNDRVKKLLWFGVSTLIIAAMIYFADAQKFIQAVQKANMIWFLPTLALGVSIFSIWSYTWYSFFHKMGLNITYWKTTKMFLAGNFLNSITPLGQFGGEPFMAYIISKNTEASYEKAFSTVFSADIVNGIPMFTFVMGGAGYLLLFGSGFNQIVLQTVYMAILTTVVGGSIVYLLWFKAGFIESKILGFMSLLANLIGRGQSIVDRVDRSLDKVQESFDMIGENPLHIFKVAIVAHLGMIFQIGSLYFLLIAVGLTPDFTPLYFVIALSGLANFTPTPGGSGTFEAAMAGLLNLFVGMNFATALTVAILFRLSTYWPGLIMGWAAMTTLEMPER